MIYHALGVYYDTKMLLDRNILGRQKISPSTRFLIEKNKDLMDIFENISQSKSFSEQGILYRYEEIELT